MKKGSIIKRQEDFNRIIKEGSCIKNHNFVLYYEKNSLGYDKYGISVGKKIGNAVIRNKYKRKIRSIIDEYKKDYQNSTNYIIILRKSCLLLSYQEMRESLFKLMINHHKNEEPKNERKKV